MLLDDSAAARVPSHRSEATRKGLDRCAGGKPSAARHNRSSVSSRACVGGPRCVCWRRRWLPWGRARCLVAAQQRQASRRLRPHKRRAMETGVASPLQLQSISRPTAGAQAARACLRACAVKPPTGGGPLSKRHRVPDRPVLGVGARSARGALGVKVNAGEAARGGVGSAFQRRQAGSAGVGLDR
jgi:hypothetical protein